MASLKNKTDIFSDGGCIALMRFENSLVDNDGNAPYSDSGNLYFQESGKAGIYALQVGGNYVEVEYAKYGPYQPAIQVKGHSLTFWLSIRGTDRSGEIIRLLRSDTPEDYYFRMRFDADNSKYIFECDGNVYEYSISNPDAYHFITLSRYEDRFKYVIDYNEYFPYIGTTETSENYYVCIGRETEEFGDAVAYFQIDQLRVWDKRITRGEYNFMRLYYDVISTTELEPNPFAFENPNGDRVSLHTMHNTLLESVTLKPPTEFNPDDMDTSASESTLTGYDIQSGIKPTSDDSYVKYENIIHIYDDFSVSFRAYNDGGNGVLTRAYKTGDASLLLFELSLDDDNDVYTFKADDGSGEKSITFDNPAGEKTFVFVYDSATGKLSCYKDGVLMGYLDVDFPECDMTLVALGSDDDSIATRGGFGMYRAFGYRLNDYMVSFLSSGEKESDLIVEGKFDIVSSVTSREYAVFTLMNTVEKEPEEVRFALVGSVEQDARAIVIERV